MEKYQIDEAIRLSRFKQDFADSTIFLNDFIVARDALRQNWNGVCQNWESGGEDFVLNLYSTWERQFGKEKSALAVTRLIADQSGTDESNDSTGLRVSKILKSENTPDIVRDKLTKLIGGENIFEIFRPYPEITNPKSKVRSSLFQYEDFISSVFSVISIDNMEELIGFDHNEWIKKFYGSGSSLLKEIQENKAGTFNENDIRFILAEGNDNELFKLSFAGNTTTDNINFNEFVTKSFLGAVKTGRYFKQDSIWWMSNHIYQANHKLKESRFNNEFTKNTDQAIFSWIRQMIDHGYFRDGIYNLQNIVRSWGVDPENIDSLLKIFESTKIPFIKILSENDTKFYPSHSNKFYIAQIITEILPNLPEAKISEWKEMYIAWTGSDFIAKKVLESTQSGEILFGKIITEINSSNNP